MLCQIINRIGFDLGVIFENFEKFFENIFFKKAHYFWVWRLFVGVYCDFGWLDVFLGFMGEYRVFVFCWGLIFGLFLCL